MIKSWKKILFVSLLWMEFNHIGEIEANQRQSFTSTSTYNNNQESNNSEAGSIWNNLWKLSCDYVSNHLESSSSIEHRAKRSSINKLNRDNNEIDFNDPEQLFNYLYPLAHVQVKDLIKRKYVNVNVKEGEGGREGDVEEEDEQQSGRSNTLPDEFTVSSLIGDLLEFWQTECELRDTSKPKEEKDIENGRRRRGREQHRDDDGNHNRGSGSGDDDGDMKNEEDEIENVVAEDDVNVDDDDDGKYVTNSKERSRRNLPVNHQQYDNDEKNLQVTSYSISDSSQIVRPDQTPSMRSYFNSLSSSTSGSSGTSRVMPNYANRRRRRRKKKKGQPPSTSIERPSLSFLSSRSDADDNGGSKGLSSTEPSISTTTAAAAAKASEDDNFFSSYGGDIEYFFPLLSFGIPFDGEITFLGFHGFKGIFPYKR